MMDDEEALEMEQTIQQRRMELRESLAEMQVRRCVGSQPASESLREMHHALLTRC